MSSLEIAFWACAALVVYPYAAYPVALALWAALRPRPVRRGPFRPRAVSVVVCAHNEQPVIDRRLRDLADVLDAAGIPGEIILVSDGSTDETAAAARALGNRYVNVLELPGQVGKAAALSRGVQMARHAVVVLADARQTWAPEALARLLENFADPQVGAVSGDLVLDGGPGVLGGVGLYWRYEKWLRRLESLVWSQVGVTGAICAVRRELFRPIPAGTLLDDVYWPLVVAMRGFRVVHDSRAVAYDRLPEYARDEFRRKVRTLAGNLQLACRLPGVLLPWRNPLWLPFLSHKLARLAAPWALAGLLATSAALGGGVYRAALLAQVGCYALGLAGLLTRRGGRPAAAAASFVLLNAAAAVAFCVWASGRAGRSWLKASYDNAAGPVPASGSAPGTTPACVASGDAAVRPGERAPAIF